MINNFIYFFLLIYVFIWYKICIAYLHITNGIMLTYILQKKKMKEKLENEKKCLSHYNLLIHIVVNYRKLINIITVFFYNIYICI